MPPRSPAPALWLALGLGGGIWLGHAFRVPFILSLGTAAGLVTLAAWQVHRRPARLVSLRPLAWTLLAGAGLALTGAVRFATVTLVPPGHVSRLVPSASSPVTLIGHVDAPPVCTPDVTRFVLATQAVIPVTDTLRTEGRVQVTIRTHGSFPPCHAVDWGDHVRVVGRLQGLPRKRNPAAFGYGAYLKRQGVDAILTLSNTKNVAVLGHEISWWGRIAHPLRAHVRESIHRWVPAAGARAVLSALLLGDRSGIDPDTRAHFAQTGLMHVLAISGLHVLLIGWALYAVLGPVLTRFGLTWHWVTALRSAATLVVLLLYLSISGGSASVVRAVVMTGFFVGGTVLQRTTNALNTLGAAGIVLLLIRPMLLFDVGFQLSFAAVAAILRLNPTFEAWLPDRWRRWSWARWALGMITVSLAATLGTLPVMLYHFGQVAFAGLVLNLIAIPATTGALLSGVLLVLTAGAWPAVAAAFGAAAAFFSTVLLGTAAGGAAWLSWTVVEGYVRDGWLLATLVGGLLALARWRRKRMWRRFTGATLVCLTMSLWTDVWRDGGRPGLDLLFFDVGHGDAALVRFPNGRHLLVDAGVRHAFVDQGTRTLLPHFERYGIDRIDAVLLSHPHSDHIGGLLSVLETVPVGRVVDNGQVYDSSLYARSRALIDSLGIDYRVVAAGDTLVLDSTTLVEVLHPADRPRVEDDANEASVVVRIAYGSTTILFMGDAGVPTETALAEQYGDLLSGNVIKVGHHGSRTSSAVEFVRRVTSGAGPPEWAVVSVGPARIYGLPDEEVIERWKRHGAEVRSTEEHGAVWLRSDGVRVTEVPWRRE